MFDWDLSYIKSLWYDPSDTMDSWQTVLVIALPASEGDHGRPKGKPRPIIWAL